MSLDLSRDGEERDRDVVRLPRSQPTPGQHRAAHPRSDRPWLPPVQRLRAADDGVDGVAACAARFRPAVGWALLARSWSGLTLPMPTVERAGSVGQQGFASARSRLHRGATDDAGGADGAADHRSAQLAACLRPELPQGPLAVVLRRLRARFPRSALPSLTVPVECHRPAALSACGGR